MYITLSVKQFVCLFLLILMVSSCKYDDEQEFIVKGTGFEELEGQTLYLWKLEDMISLEELPIDSAVVTNGAFQFRGKEDTIHIYYINESIRFFPERGTNLIDPVAPCRSCTPRNQKYWELRQSGLPEEESYRFMKENIGNAMGVYMFDRYTGIRPDDMEDLYGKTNEQMRSSFPLTSVKEQIDTTPRLGIGSPFIDFETTDLDDNTLRLSAIAGQGEYVAVLFLLNMNEKNYVENYINELVNAYPGLKTVLISYPFNPAPADKEFEKKMQSRPDIWWIPDNRHYEKSIHYRYRIRGVINYLVLIAPDGYIADMKTILQDTPSYFAQFYTLFAAWKENYRTNPKTRISSSTRSAKELEEYPRLLRMGKGILPFVITQLADEDNFFALTLYDDLQEDENLKVSSYGKGEQERAKETVKKFVEFHLGIKKREFASDEEKLAAMKELCRKYEWEDDPEVSEEERDRELLKADYEITEEFFKLMKYGEK